MQGKTFRFLGSELTKFEQKNQQLFQLYFKHSFEDFSYDVNNTSFGRKTNFLRKICKKTPESSFRENFYSSNSASQEEKFQWKVGKYNWRQIWVESVIFTIKIALRFDSNARLRQSVEKNKTVSSMVITLPRHAAQLKYSEEGAPYSHLENELLRRSVYKTPRKTFGLGIDFTLCFKIGSHFTTHHHWKHRIFGDTKSCCFGIQNDEKVIGICAWIEWSWCSVQSSSLQNCCLRSPRNDLLSEDVRWTSFIFQFKFEKWAE